MLIVPKRWKFRNQRAQKRSKGIRSPKIRQCTLKNDHSQCSPWEKIQFSIQIPVFFRVTCPTPSRFQMVHPGRRSCMGGVGNPYDPVHLLLGPERRKLDPVPFWSCELYRITYLYTYIYLYDMYYIHTYEYYVWM